jgi:hypothetical protein
MQSFYLYISIKDMYSFISQFIYGWKETTNVICSFLLACKRITALSIQFPSMQLTVFPHMWKMIFASTDSPPCQGSSYSLLDILTLLHLKRFPSHWEETEVTRARHMGNMVGAQVFPTVTILEGLWYREPHSCALSCNTISGTADACCNPRCRWCSRNSWWCFVNNSILWGCIVEYVKC